MKRLAVAFTLLAGCGAWNPATGFLRPDAAGFAVTKDPRGVVTEMGPDYDGDMVNYTRSTNVRVLCPWWATPGTAGCVSKEQHARESEGAPPQPSVPLQ